MEKKEISMQIPRDHIHDPYPWLGNHSKFKQLFCQSKDSIEIPEHLFDATIKNSHNGWLLMSESDDSSDRMFFYNPFTKVTINLPDPPGLCISCQSFGFFSSSSSLSDWVCVGLFGGFPKTMETYYIRSGEEGWHQVLIETDVDFEPNYGNSPVVLYDEDGHEAFYFLSKVGNLGVLRLDENGVKWEVLENPKTPCDRKSYESNYLIECGGELVSVFVGVYGTWIKVFKLNHVLMVWERVKDLRNHMLFISSCSSFSQLATNPSMANRIYLPKFSVDGDRVVYFSLHTRKFHFLELDIGMASKGVAPAALHSYYIHIQGIKGPLNSCWILPTFQ